MNLGIIYNKNNKIKNHRSLLKVLLNPFLRFFGIQIASKFDVKNQKLGSLMIICCSKQINFTFKYKLEKGDYVIKKRMFF